MHRTVKLPAGLHLSCLVLLLLVSVYLRLKGLNTQSYWNDELASLVLTDPDNNFFQVVIETLDDKSPLLYQLILWAWFKLFGFTEISGRSLSAFTGILALPAMYCMARECMNKNTALYAVLITGLNYYQIYYSQEVRSYGLFFLLACMSVLYLARLTRERNNRNLVLFTFFTICLVQSHYYGLLVYLGLLCTLVLYKLKNDSAGTLPARYLKINSFATFISLLPVIPFMVINALRDSTWIDKPDPDFLIAYFRDYFGGDTLSFVYAILFFGGLLFLLRQKEQRHRYLVYMVIFVFLFVYILPYLRSLVSTPMIVGRYTIGVLPLIILIIAAGLDAIKQNSVKAFVVILVITLNFYVLFFHRDYYGGVHKQQYRDVVEHVIAGRKDVPVFACKHERVEKYFKILGHPTRVLGDDELYNLIKDGSAPGTFWYIGSTCCGCQESTKIANEYRHNHGIVLDDQLVKYRAFAYLVSDFK